ncbi:MAG: tetratricopeptide repeat protein [Bacteroidales bacterium]|nr:MAG: tetratricopeptide repeat protein [Bacteroidales bacterium]
MLKNLLPKLFVLLVSASFLISCKTSYLTVDVLKPARIDVPREIKSVAVINRSLPAKEERAMNIIEGVISGEGIFNDRVGSEKCVIGVVELLNNSPRFTAVFPGDIDMRGTGTDRFPPALEWDAINSISNKYKVDAVIALETFDSDSHTDYDRREYTREEDGRKVRYVEYNAEVRMEIEAGWRIYYPAKERIVDENVYVDHISWDADGPTREAAKRNLPSKSRIIEDAGFFAGEQYAARISPVWIKVSRNYYSKGNEELERASRYARQGNWEEAAGMWENVAKSSDPKIAGYAAYNLALSNEMQGDLDTALQWAEKSYYDFNNKKARNYINTIKRRIADERRLDKQLED